jgi:ABC-type glycerol-3-phosphate transport system permease component
LKDKKLRQDIIHFVVLAIFSLFILYPLLWMLGNSLKSDKDMTSSMWKILPTHLNFIWKNYIDAWNIGQIGTTAINSIIITFSSLILIVIISFLASYAVARIDFYGKGIVMILLLSMMMVPLGQVIMIPQYRLERLLNLTNTLQGLVILYINAGIPISVFLLSAFMQKIPIELDEAATIDGCTRFQIVTKILFPLTRPGLATVVIFQFMAIWNDYFTPLIYLHDESKRTVTLGLANFVGLWGVTDYNKMFAALVIITVPIIIIYIIFQKQFISGLTSGAVKS